MTTISVDDGSQLDFRVADLLRKYGHKATFYWSKYNPKHEVMSEDNMLQFVANYPENEIQQHTYSHPLLTQVPLERAESDMERGYCWHYSLFGVKPVGLCVPRGYVTYGVAFRAKKLGFRYIRTVKEKDALKIKINGLYAMGGGYHFSHPASEYRGEESAWGHSWELTRFGLWDRFEEWLKKMPPSITNTEYVNSQ